MNRAHHLFSLLLMTVALFFLGYVIIGRTNIKAALLVESDPVSNVYINGKHMGITPYKYEGVPGEVLLSVIPHDGVSEKYETLINLKGKTQTIVRRMFGGEEGSSGDVVYFTEAPLNKSFIEIISIPDAADITVDSHHLGLSPTRAPLSPGEHSVKVSKDGFIGYEGVIKTEPGLVTNIRVDLVKTP